MKENFLKCLFDRSWGSARRRVKCDWGAEDSLDRRRQRWRFENIKCLTLCSGGGRHWPRWPWGARRCSEPGKGDFILYPLPLAEHQNDKDGVKLTPRWYFFWCYCHNTGDQAENGSGLGGWDVKQSQPCTPWSENTFVGVNLANNMCGKVLGLGDLTKIWVVPDLSCHLLVFTWPNRSIIALFFYIVLFCLHGSLPISY